MCENEYMSFCFERKKKDEKNILKHVAQTGMKSFNSSLHAHSTQYKPERNAQRQNE